VELTTVLYGVLLRDPDGGVRLRWSNAGHLSPLLVLPGGTARYLAEPVDPVIGVLGLALELGLGSGVQGARSEGYAELPPGATLLLYTDGLVESRDDQLESGMDLLARYAADLATVPVGDMCDAIISAMATDAEDDVALLAIRVPGTPEIP
jgi:serine phosphatase RsbU (regulator of sigma subunit)